MKTPPPGGLGRQISLVVVGDVVTVVSVLVAGMVLARLMAPSEMGTYRQVLYLGQLAVSLAELGLGSSIYRFWNALDEAGRRVYARMLLLTTLLLGLLAAAALALLAEHVAVWYKNPDLKLALLIAAPYPLAAIPIQFLRPVLISQGFSLKATALETLFALMAVLAVAVPVALGARLTTALMVWIVVCLSRVVLVPVFLRDYLFGPGPWWRRRLAAEVWGYLWPIQVSRIPGVVTSYLDQVAMSLYLAPKAFAVYSMGAREIPLVGVVGPSVSNVLIPHLVEDVAAGRIDQICRRWRTACLTTAVLTYPVAAFCILYSVPVMQFMFSSTYSDSSVPFRIFAAITFLRVVEYASLARAFNRTRLIMQSAAISATVMSVLAFVLTLRFGVVGMASAVFIGYLTAGGYLLLAYRLLFRQPVSRFFPWLPLGFLGAVSLCVGFVSRWTMSSILPFGSDEAMFSLAWKLVTHFAVYVAFYIAGFVLTGYVRPGVVTADLRAVIDSVRGNFGGTV